ncbi:MAG TPA: hypothetical protein PKD86_09195 [Gemmatales bacterium]|nr:hypothetical protein [Gemmatales bacterium]HMP59514.1 hypothetical protein [Gemmatales bacterium]
MSAPRAGSHPLAPPALGWWHAWTRFWFTPSDPFGLHVLRVATAALVLAWLLPFAGHVDATFGLDGWVDARAYQELRPTPTDMGLVDPRGWSLLFVVGTSSAALHACYWATIGLTVLFLFGLCVRPLAVVLWLATSSFSANPIIEADTDVYLRIFTFYLMIGYLLLDQGRARAGWLHRLIAPWEYSLLRRPTGEPVPGSAGATMAVRLWQLHIALLIVVSGLHKLQMPEWWTGIALWYLFHRPDVATPESLLAWGGNRFTVNLSLLSLGAYVMLAWQILFPAFAWRRGWGRWLLLGGAASGALGLMLLFPTPLLGPTFFVAMLGFLAHEDAAEMRERLGRLFARRSATVTKGGSAGGSLASPAVAGKR